MSTDKKKQMLESLERKKNAKNSTARSSNTTTPSSDSRADDKAAQIAKLKADLQRKKDARKIEDEQDAEIARLMREHEELDKSVSSTTASLKKSTISTEEAQIAELRERSKKLDEDLKVATSVPSSTMSEIEKLRKAVADKEAELKAVSSTKAAEGESTRRRLADLEREKESLLRKRDALPSTSMLSSERGAAERSLARVQYGIDVCFLMDCTGSMGSFIQAAKTKIREIVAEVEKIESRAIIRIAFVGYRDHSDGAQRLEKLDFIESGQPAAFEDKLQKCPATGGADGPEDVAGGLQTCTQLSWNSSTRLLIHFADAPCHGTQYHSMPDDYPSGDPNGLIPEDLLRTLAKKRIEYYFMKITQYTDKMTGIFKNTYEEMGKQFFIIPISSNAADFVPKVVNSICSSMARSAAFAPPSGSSSYSSSSSSSSKSTTPSKSTGRGAYGTSGVF